MYCNIKSYTALKNSMFFFSEDTPGQPVSAVFHHINCFAWKASGGKYSSSISDVTFSDLAWTCPWHCPSERKEKERKHALATVCKRNSDSQPLSGDRRLMSIKNKNKEAKDASDLSGFLCLAVWQARQGQSQSEYLPRWRWPDALHWKPHTVRLPGLPVAFWKGSCLKYFVGYRIPLSPLSRLFFLKATTEG